jgi:hypothetical protein
VRQIFPSSIESILVSFLLALISSRLLASITDSDISSRACALLREARNVTYRWICEVGKKLESTHDETSCAGLRRRLCMLAVTCFSTFDVCSKHMPHALASDEDFSIAIQCAVIVHDNTPQCLSDSNSNYLALIISRHCRLLHYLEPNFSQSLPAVLGEAILLHARAFDDALAQLWLGYRRRTSSNWHALPRPNSRWISCVAEGGHVVHYDILTGRLLINGKPLGRLPQEIVEHPTYASVLGTVSGQTAAFPTFSDILSENSRCGSCRHPWSGFHDSIHCVRVSGKGLFSFSIL